MGLPSAYAADVPTGNNNKAPNYRSTVLTPVLTPLSRPVLNRVNTTFRVFNNIPYSGFTVSTLTVFSVLGVLRPGPGQNHKIVHNHMCVYMEIM